ncbi:MAG: hypothetical protein RLZZ129_2059 [Verrucomicrobiota bacterium]|jgi:hypothetical protein
MQLMLAQLARNQSIQVPEGVQMVIVLIVGVLALALAVYWLFLPWLLLRRMDRMITLLDQIRDEVAFGRRPAKETSSVRYPG